MRISFRYPVFLLLMVCGLAIEAGEMEQGYLAKHCIPLVRDFMRKHRPSYSADFPTNNITHWRVEYEPDSEVVLSRLMLDRRYAFLFIGNKTTNGIQSFKDKGSSWSDSLMDPSREKEMREIASRTNLLNDSTALALAKECFRLRGHDERNFHPVRFKQLVWAWGVPSRRIVLPFYEADWARRDVKLPVEEIETIYPSVFIVISGLESNMVSYSKIQLPFGMGDFDVDPPPPKRTVTTP